MTGIKGVLLVNLGTPNSPSVSDVRKYLKEFLMDKRVIDTSYLSRWWLVHFIISPFRSPKSAKEYQQLWDERGSPLKYYGEALTVEVQLALGDTYKVVLAMRYQTPSIATGLGQLKNEEVTSIKVIPLFPHYASASTGSVIQEVMRCIQDWQVIPKLDFVPQFYNHPKLIEAFAENARMKMQKTDYDHFVFSYHGLPERQIMKAGINHCQLGACCHSCNQKNRYCYRAQCFATTTALIQALGLSQTDTSTCFQSRLGKTPWIKPYTDKRLVELAKAGKKKILVFSPAFVADCLETTFEVGRTYRDAFIAAGGEQWDLVESLNVHPSWVKGVVEMAQD